MDPLPTSHNLVNLGPGGAGSGGSLGLGDSIAPGRPVEVAVATRRMTVVMPVYNEAATLAATLDAVSEYAQKNTDCRFLFVNDGSSDETETILRSRLAVIGGAELSPEGVWTGPRDAGVALLSYVENRGKGHAVRTAMLLADSDLVCFMDGDLAYLPEDHLPAMIESLRSADVCIGSRRESPDERRNTKRLRRLMGWTFNKIVRLGLNLPLDDTQAGVKGFTRRAAEIIFTRSTLSGFSFDVELLFIARRHRLKIVEIPAKVARAHRKKPTKVNLATEPMRMLGDLVKVRWKWLCGRYR